MVVRNIFLSETQVLILINFKCKDFKKEYCISLALQNIACEDTGSEIFGVQENCCFKKFLWKVTRTPLKNKSLLQAPQKSGLFKQPKNTVKRDFEIHPSWYFFQV